MLSPRSAVVVAFCSPLLAACPVEDPAPSDSDADPTAAGTTEQPPTAPADDGGTGSTSIGMTSVGSGGTSTASGTTTSPGTDEAGSSSEDGPVGPIFDLSVPDGGGGEPPMKTPPWLVHLANEDGARQLYHIDIETAVATHICTIIDAATMMPYDGGSPSITFTRDDRLIFSGNNSIWEIELPSCITTEIGPIGFTQVNGISPDEGDDLFGISGSSDVLLRIDAQTGQGTEVGPLGQSWGLLGGTWSEVEQEIYGINSSTDALYQIDAATGMATVDQMLPIDFQNVGVEFHPLTERIYACTSNSHLYRLEPDGSVTDLGDMGFDTCTNLGAPWSEDIELPPPR